MAKTIADANIRVGYDAPLQARHQSFLASTGGLLADLAKIVSNAEETRMALRRRRYASLLREGERWDNIL